MTGGQTAARGRAQIDEGIEAIRRGRRDEAALLFSRGLDVLDGIEDDEERHTELGTAGLVLDKAGFPDLALSALSDAVELSEELGDRRALAEDVINQGRAYLHLDRLPEAEQCFRRALAICEEEQHWDNAASAATNIAIIIGKQGRMDEAIDLLKGAVANVERRPGHPSNEVVTRMATLQALVAVDRDHLYAIEIAKPLLGRLSGELRPDQRDNTVGPLRQCIERYAAIAGRDAEDLKREHFPGVAL
jgi:tetratricopeptide (TPR) repeat protein